MKAHGVRVHRQVKNHCLSVRIEAAVMRCADKIQHWLAETLAGRAECVSHAIFFIFWLNATAIYVLM